MRFNERHDFLVDPVIFSRQDTVLALKIVDEYCTKLSARPAPKFFEVDTTPGAVDPVWHSNTGERLKFMREIEVPALNKFVKPDWKLTRIGITPQRRDDFIISFNTLQRLDYFPQRGDRVYWNGYRYLILQVVLDPESYFQQTNQWTSLRVECCVVPDGDAKPVPQLDATIPAEKSTSAKSEVW